MTAGFQAFNSSGSLQFDATTYAFACVGKGTLVATDHTTSSPFTISTWGIADTGIDFDLVFMRCSEAFFLPYNIRFNGDPVGRLRIYTQYCQHPTGMPTDEGTGLSSHHVDYFLFKSMKFMTPAAHGAGLQIFDDSGYLCYDSNLEPAGVVHNLNIFSAQTAETTQALADSANTAIAAFGITADPLAISGQTHFRQQVIKTISAGYKRRSFLNNHPYGVPKTGTQPGVYTGGFFGIDTTRL